MQTNTTQSAAYNVGLIDENIIVNKLCGKYPGKVFLSSTQDNIVNDIDVWINGKPTSIKCYAPSTPANFAFELENLHRDTNKWSDSWYYNGKASVYLIWHQKFNEVYHISKQKIVEYVNTIGFDRKTELKESTKQSQININHTHINTRLGLLKISQMLELGIAKVLFNTNDYPVELAQYNASSFTKPPVYITPIRTDKAKVKLHRWFG